MSNDSNGNGNNRGGSSAAAGCGIAGLVLAIVSFATLLTCLQIFLGSIAELAGVGFLLTLSAMAAAAAALVLSVIGFLKETKHDRKKAVSVIGLCLSTPTLLFSIVVLILSM